MLRLSKDFFTPFSSVLACLLVNWTIQVYNSYESDISVTDRPTDDLTLEFWNPIFLIIVNDLSGGLMSNNCMDLISQNIEFWD